MPLVDFNTVSNELELTENIRVMSALIRSSLAHGADNKPAMVILTDDAIFWGGSEAMSGNFQRVSLKSIISSERTGKLIWECVEVRHMDLDGEKTIYLCPFTGSPSAPLKDRESMDALISHLKQK